MKSTCFLSKLSNLSKVSFTFGIATAIFPSISSFFFSINVFNSDAFSKSTCAIDDSASTLSFSTFTVAAIVSALFFFSSTSILLITNISFKSATVF